MRDVCLSLRMNYCVIPIREPGIISAHSGCLSQINTASAVCVRTGECERNSGRIDSHNIVISPERARIRAISDSDSAPFAIASRCARHDAQMHRCSHELVLRHLLLLFMLLLLIQLRGRLGATQCAYPGRFDGALIVPVGLNKRLGVYHSGRTQSAMRPECSV